MRRAVITGLGILSSIGNSKEEVLESLRRGTSGISFSRELEDRGLRCKIWGDVDVSPNDLIDRRMVKFMGGAAAYTYLAMEQAIKDSQLTDDIISNERTGVIAGSGGGSPRNRSDISDRIRTSGLRGINPHTIVRSMPSNVSACLSTFFKIRGLSYSISSACATSAHCIGNAAEIIRLDKQDVMFAGGGEELGWEMACEFDAMGALSTRHNASPRSASRAYDVDRDGFVISGGGGIVVVEDLEHALGRGAHVYAEIVGYGATSDGCSILVPTEDGMTRCMRMALSGATRPVDYINGHGTSTKVGDLRELRAIREAFGLERLPAISSTKSMTGHSLGAAGVHEIIFTLLMLENNFIAPSINIDRLEPEADGMDIVTKTRECQLDTAMSNSFGFGGTNSSIVLSKHPAR